MIPLSSDAKQAIKIALAMTIAMGIGLWMGWDKPYWAGIGVAVISLDTSGQSLNKAAMRMLGTLVAALAALTFIAWFPQDRWWFMAVLSIYVGLCAYMITGKKIQYFWFVSGFVCLVIGVSASVSMTPFEVAVERTQETGLGILTYALVSALLWPRDSRDTFEDASRRLFAVQARLYRTYRDLMSGKGTADDAMPLTLEGIQLLSQVGQWLNAAETDSYEVWEVRHQWRRFHKQSTALMETFAHLRTSLPEIETLDLTTLLPNLDALWSELDLSFAQTERMLAGQAPERMPQAVTLTFDKAEIDALSRFQAAAVAVTISHLERLEALSRSLFDCVRDLRGFGSAASKPLPEQTPRAGLAIDPDRFRGVISILATLWISFLIWVYVDPPGHESFVMMATIMTMVVVMSGAGPVGLVLTMILGSLLAGVLYVFVMPHLSGYGQLGLMIFAVTFVVSYLFSAPRQAGAKTLVLAMFISGISVQNEQSYNFAAYANTLTMTILMGALIVATTYIPTSPRPEKVFLRLIRRFFRHARLLMSELAPDAKHKRNIAGRWKTLLYRNDLLELPQKLALCGQKIDHRIFPDNTPEQVEALVTALRVFALRFKALVDAGEYPQADLLVRELRDDVRAWRLLVEEQCRLWAEDPEAAVEPGVDSRERLTARLAKMEVHIEETFRQAQAAELSVEDRRNFYRLLGSYRGLSEAGIAYEQLAKNISWATWQEARF